MRNALLSAARAAGETVRIGFDRLAGARGGVPGDLAGVTPEWLAAALAPHAPGVEVRSFELLDAHAGTTQRARLGLRYGNGAAGLPETLFLKLAPADWKTLVFVNLMGLARNEVGFYRDVRPRARVRAPEVYAARLAGSGGRFALLLEDLAARGCEFRDITRPCDLAQARAVVRALARLHADFWESPRFAGDLAWLEAPGAHRNAAVERALVEAATRRVLRRFGGGLPGPVRDAARRVCAERPRLEAWWARLPSTLIHGDPHVGNLYFDGDEVGLLDWQVVQRGPGLRDVSYFLLNSTGAALRRRHERELIGLYLDALAGEGATGPSLDEAWEQHRLNALYVWISCVVTAAAAGALQPEAVARAGLERAATALQDLGSIDALRALAQGRRPHA